MVRQYLTRRETSGLLRRIGIRVSTATLATWASRPADGHIPFVKRGARVYYAVEEVAAFAGVDLAALAEILEGQPRAEAV
jgi:hypothetical protein